MRLLPADHPERTDLADEVHARPPEALDTPGRASYVAVLMDRAAREAEGPHLAELCEHFGVPAPAASDNHYAVDLKGVRLKWERHGEFSAFTFYAAGQSPQPFSDPPISRLPEGWLARIPGQTIYAAHAKLITGTDAQPDAELLGRYFDGNVVVGAEIGGGAGLAYTDFRVRADGFGRFLLVDWNLTPRQAGRMVQRLFEIEAYRMMALLALPLARAVAPQLAANERELAALATELASSATNDEALLGRLTRLAAEVEAAVTRTQYRFNACRAYHELVRTRTAELRERRLPGIQPIEEFMSRRFSPAVATCQSTAQRLHQLTERIGHASALLSTRVDIVRERQNQHLLEAMNLRAERQFRLQQAVEGLSVAAIVYYGTGLVGYATKALKALGLHINPDLATGIAIPVLALACILALRRAHARLAKLGGSTRGER